MSRPRIFSFLILVIASAQVVIGSERYDPRLKFRTLRTPHFDIFYHQGEDGLARRLARIAEEVAGELARDLGRPSSRVRVILVDQSDLANGWATPVPYDLIEIQAVPPRAESLIGNTDDWLRLVFSHEYTHIVHLDRSRGWIGGLRNVFGRLPVLYPNIFLPQWQIEGIATYEESKLTGRGRIEAGDFRMLIDRAAGAQRFLHLDEASGGLVDWPSGTAAYLYGGFFHEYLARQYGADKIAALARETSGRIPYLGAPAFRKVFGKSLGTLWKEFEADTRARVEPETIASTRLTTHGFTVTAPRFDAAGNLYYTIANPHGFPALMRLAPGQSPRRIASRYLGNRTATAGDLIVFDQLELVRNVGLQSDLFVRASDGGTRRLTREARAADPDVSADGRTIACTVQGTGSRALATMPLHPQGAPIVPTVLVSEADAEFSSPRWSPDGRTIAVERRRLGGPSEIVLVHVETRSTRTLVSSARGRNVTPEWTHDGRSVLFASDRSGDGFRIYAADVETGAVRRLVGTGDGAEAPTVSPDGRTLAYVGYTTAGYDLFAIALDGARWEPGSAEPVEPPIDPVARRDVDPVASTSAYRPWRTLAPTFWTPLAATDADEFVAGGATGGVDALGRHGYYASALWSASRARPDWTIGYAYDRWWPTFYGDFSDDTDPWRAGEVRTTELNAGAVLPLVRVRWRQAALAAWHGSTDHFQCEVCSHGADAKVTRRAVRLGWFASNAKSFGYSVSGETGGAVSVNAEFTRAALGADGDAEAVTIDARHYLPVWPRHAVIAGRVAAASSSGDERARRIFSAGGNGPQPGGFAFGADAIGLLRGYDDDQVAGQRAVVGNLDYRFPLVYVQRGAGTWPFLVRSLHGAIFADAGQAWDRGSARGKLRTSFGAELSMDAVIGYALPLSVTAGIALRDDPVAGRREAVGFARVGRAF